MSDEPLDAADAFSAIGNEYRVAILRALMVAYQQEQGATPIAYSDLMSRAGLDDSGQFNYHLQQLVGRFVTEDADGYALTYAGRTVAAAIASGTLDESASLEPTSIDGSCYACGDEALVLRYPDDRVRVSCSSCGEELVHIQFPPAGVADRTVAQLERDFDRWERSWRSLAGDGICPECSSRMTGELNRERGTPAAGNVSVRAVLSCDRCWTRAFMPPGVLLLDHPAVVSFLWEHGMDVRDRPLWHHEWALAADSQTVVTEDPLRVRIEIPAPNKGATLSVTVGNTLKVESVTERREF